MLAPYILLPFTSIPPLYLALPLANESEMSGSKEMKYGNELNALGGLRTLRYLKTPADLPLRNPGNDIVALGVLIDCLSVFKLNCPNSTLAPLIRMF